MFVIHWLPSMIYSYNVINSIIAAKSYIPWREELSQSHSLVRIKVLEFGRVVEIEEEANPWHTLSLFK
jgi:hypothetical protein